MRTFEHFPPETVCPLCGTADDRECFLMPIAGTQQDGHICKATVVHVSCMTDERAGRFMHYKKEGVIAAVLAHGENA